MGVLRIADSALALVLYNLYPRFRPSRNWTSTVLLKPEHPQGNCILTAERM